MSSVVFVDEFACLVVVVHNTLILMKWVILALVKVQCCNGLIFYFILEPKTGGNPPYEMVLLGIAHGLIDNKMLLVFFL